MARRPSANASAVNDVAVVATGKSCAEISALRHLREAYEALGVRVDGTPDQERPVSHPPSSPTKETFGRGPLSSRGRVLDTVRALQLSAASPNRGREVFNQWLAWETLAQAVEIDALALQHEIQAAEVRTRSTLQLPAEGFDTLDPKLLVLSEVLGREAFTSYAKDLFHELATLRQRCSLYENTLGQFQEQVQRRCIGAHRMHDVVSVHDWLKIANASLSALRLDTGTPLLLGSEFPVLVQHCSPPRLTENDEDSVVAVMELLLLLERLPPARERLVSLCFEQITDVRRGAGLAPPPDSVRPHKLAALAKRGHADMRCSQEERDRILEWLDEQAVDDDGAQTVSRAVFLRFHVAISDTYAHEDAEFVAFLVRVWQFEIPQDLGVSDVVADYDARCQELTAMARKRQLLKKLDHARDALRSRLASLRHLVAQLNSVSVENAEQYERLVSHQQLTSSTLLGLRILRLSGLSLRQFPVFVVALPLLEELHLGDNQLRDSLPLSMIGAMKTLKKLVLSDNFLTDPSLFDPESTVWKDLSNLTTLELSHNQLTTIPRVIIGLKGLKHLGLSANRLRDRGVALDVASQWQELGFPQLQTLNLRQNQLSALPDVVFTTGQKSLEALYIQDNQLTELPPSFSLMESLCEAVCSRNRLKDLGASDVTPLLTRCGKLQELLLDHNQLRLFPVQSPSSQASIQGIQAICCVKNRLRSLPALDNLTFQACERLDLRGNALTEISDAFFPAFPVLKSCHLQQNAIKRLPDSIAQCARLQVLEVYENKLDSVPSNLSTLKALAVLNLRENQLTTVPTEWHAFAYHQQSDRRQGNTRMLQTLHLQRNPFRSQVLQSLVDRGARDRASCSNTVSSKSNAAQIEELFVHKLIESLKQSVAVQRLASDLHPLAHREEDDYDGDEGSGRRRWKGRARFVVQHIEAQLRAKCEATDDCRKQLQLTTMAFEKLLQTVLAASTQKERRLVSERFRVRVPGHEGLVDGWSFLCGIEAIGLTGTLSAVGMEPTQGGALDPRRCDSVHKPLDTVASILQYLQVAHNQKQRPSVPDPALQPIKSGKPTHPRAAPAVKEVSRARRPTSAKTARDTAAEATGKEASRGRDVHQVAVLERCRQRIRVLEQQLMDQQLLRLDEQNKGHAVADAPPLVMNPQPASPHSSDARAANSSAPAASTMEVYVKELNRRRAAYPTDGERFVVAVAPDATVAQLKEAIAACRGIHMSRQVLVAKTTQSAGDHERLRDGTRLAQYFHHPPAAPARRWHVSLIVSDALQVDWSNFRKHSDVKESREALCK